MENLKIQESPIAGRPSPLYHLKTVYLFTKSDFKTVVLPEALFITSSLLTNGFRSLDKPPSLPLPALLQLFLHAVFWVWANLFLESIANQRLPGSIVEDASNKPWRPLPAGRITPEQAQRAALHLVPALLLFGAYSDAFRETASLIVFVWMYNDLDAANASLWWRNATNAVGLMTFSSGATAITSGRVDYSLSGTAFRWILVTGMVIATTIHAQDFPDVVGDAARGRKTIPLVYGDLTARASLVVGVVFWSVAVPAFWGLGWAGYVPTGALGLAMVVGTLWRRTLEDDAVVWKLWCLWVAAIYLLPCVGMLG